MSSEGRGHRPWPRQMAFGHVSKNLIAKRAEHIRGGNQPLGYAGL